MNFMPFMVKQSPQADQTTPLSSFVAALHRSVELITIRATP
jgi:hypothetical protein